MVGFECVLNTHLANAIVILLLSGTYCTYCTMLTIEKYVLFFNLLVLLKIVENILTLISVRACE